MPMSKRSQREATIVYVSNAPRAEELSRGGLLDHLVVRLTAQPTVTGGNNTAANTKRGGILNAMRKLRVRLNSQENVYEMDPAGILLDNWYLLGQFPREITGTLGDGTTANPSCDITFLIPFQLPRRKVGLPADTSLDLRGDAISKVEIEADWGTFTDVNAAATGWTTNPSLTVSSLKSYDVPNDFAPGFLRRYTINQLLNATNSRELIRLATTYTYFGFILNATADAVDSLTVYNRIKLISGSYVFEDHVPASLYEGMRLLHGREDREFETSSAFNARAYFPIEIPTDGNLREMLVTQQLSDFNFELDVTKQGTTCSLNVWPYQYVPPARRAA